MSPSRLWSVCLPGETWSLLYRPGPYGLSGHYAVVHRRGASERVVAIGRDYWAVRDALDRAMGAA